jgi:protein-tyrosine phosphatase
MSLALVDLHCHFLPGVDDGAADVGEALAMLRLAHAGGTRHLVATPHLFHPAFPFRGVEEIRWRFARLEAELQALAAEPRNGFLNELELALGAEHHVSTEFLTALEAGTVLPLGDGGHLLVEPSPLLSPEATELAVRRVIAAGWTPVLAHVERYPALCGDSRRLVALAELGCVAQVNATSLLAGGWWRRRSCRRLLDRGLAQVVASDGHDTRWRKPDLGDVFAALSKSFPGEQVAAWMAGNPGAALYGERDSG